MRKKVIEFMEDRKNGMAESHLSGWFSDRYVGKDRDDIEFDLQCNHDNSLLIEELEEEFKDITQEEIEFCIDEFIEEVLNCINFGGASSWIDTLGNNNNN